MSEIVLEKVTKRFGRVNAVDGVSFRAESGKFVVLLGPSGCGKSTLLRLIAGLEDVSGGRILIDGRDVSRLTPENRRISMVFQSYALFPHLSTEENIVFGLKVRGTPEKERKRRLAQVAEVVGLGELLDRKPQQLSGGQRQRVSLARALVNRPRVLLLDEPLGALDLKLREQMQVELKGLQRRLGITFVYVTHDQVEAMTLANGMIVINAGVIEQIGAPLEVYDNPASLFVAGFVGTANVLEGALARRVTGGDRPVSIRPEHIRPGEPRDGQVGVTGHSAALNPCYRQSRYTLNWRERVNDGHANRA